MKGLWKERKISKVILDSVLILGRSTDSTPGDHHYVSEYPSTMHSMADSPSNAASEDLNQGSSSSPVGIHRLDAQMYVCVFMFACASLLSLKNEVYTFTILNGHLFFDPP